MIVLNRVNDSFIATHFSVDVEPPPGFTRATFIADMDYTAVKDTTNWLRIDVEADFGDGWQRVAIGTEWHGGPGQSRPFTVLDWTGSLPPRAVRGVLVNGTHGYDSGVPAGLDLEFS